MMTATRVETIPPIARTEVEVLARTEYRRVGDQLRSLASEDWAQPTDCPDWDVRAIAGHSTGMLATFTGYRTLMGSMRTAAKAAKRSGGPMIDALTAAQVADGEKLDLGGHVVQWFDTPHVPHAWEAGVLYDTTTKTLFCGDLFTRYGEYEASTTDDIVGPAVQAEDDAPGSLSLHPASGTIVRRLAQLDIETLAPMHAPAFSGDCRAALLDLAEDFDRRIALSTTLERQP